MPGCGYRLDIDLTIWSIRTLDNPTRIERLLNRPEWNIVNRGAYSTTSKVSEPRALSDYREADVPSSNTQNLIIYRLNLMIFRAIECLSCSLSILGLVTTCLFHGGEAIRHRVDDRQDEITRYSSPRSLQTCT